MRKQLLHILIISFVFLSSPITQVVEASRGMELRVKLGKESGRPVGTYRALVIGINDYRDKKIPDLETAVNDARKVAEILKENYGFEEVELLLDEDAVESKIIKSFRRLITGSKKDDSVLVYYAGHGDLDKLVGSGWWIPQNATAQDPSTYTDNSIIQGYVRAIPARHVFLVVDSCFSGTLFGQARDLPAVIDDKYYSNLFKERSRWGMTSGNLTPVSDKGSGGHSMFAYQFIKALEENYNPYLTPREIYQKIAPIISNNSEQMPITKPIRNTNDQGGEFVFIRTGQQSLPKPDIALPPAIERDDDYFEKIAKEREESKVEWNDWQSNMSGRYSKNYDMDKGNALKPSEKVQMWNKFLAQYSTDNPYSTEDQLIRSKAMERVNYWKNWNPPEMEEKPLLSRPNGMAGRAQGLQSELTVTGTQPYTDSVAGMGLVFVEGGCFDMGDTFGDGSGSDDEKPVHEACVDDFYIGKYEVTQGQWEDVMGDNPSYFNNGSNYPVEQVSWDYVQGFIRTLNRKTGKSYRLPTEAEWEYAARSGGKREKFAGFSNENELSRYANFCDVNCEYDGLKTKSQNDGYENTSPVGNYKPNGLGLYDMSGNVWEWCQDIYSDNAYRKHQRNNPIYTGSGSYRVIRGGSWGDEPRRLRASYRYYDTPDVRANRLGFRLARTP